MLLREDDSLPAWDAAHGRYAALEDKIHAVITWIDASRDEAVALDALAARGERRGPLHGMLVGLKDNIATAGVRTTAGASFMSDNVPEQDATVVRLLRASGAIVMAKQNMAELAWGATTQNATYGSCRNPWDLDRIPGGSSGGSGASLAAGYCEASLGTDTGASVRIPAALNGVVGLRPSVGSISTNGVFPASYTQDAVGPMARSAIDAAQLTEALLRFDPDEPYSIRSTGLPATALIGDPLRGLRTGVTEQFFFDDLDAGVAKVIEVFLAWLAAQGVVRSSVGDFGQDGAHEHWTRIVQCEAAMLHRKRLESRPADFSPDVFGRISAGLGVPGTELARSLDWRERYRQRLDGVLDDLDVIVSPVVPVDVPLVGGYDSREQTAALGRITYPWALHAGPTMSLPIGFHPVSGNPVGISLTAPRFCEAILFKIAAAYQQDTDWHQRWPALVAATARTQ
ncbi:MAG: Amidase [Frankiales bacterium]|nr:Amidase [Frankiales bacterium]